MTDYTVAQPVQRGKLEPNAVLSQTWALYKRLFTRSVLMGAVIFGGLQLVDSLARASGHRVLLGLLYILLTVFGIALLQGGLVEIVRGLHVDGDDKLSVQELFQRASGRVWKLVLVSILYGVGVALGSMLFIVPGIILATRWAVAVPVAMLEDVSPSSALRRSRQILAGNGWNVFKILFVCSVLNVLVLIPITLVTASTGPFFQWIAAVLVSALAAPYYAHALTVIYYTLLEPGRPVVLEPGRRWESVWTAQDDIERAPTQATESRTETLDEEYARKYDERAKQWGG
ncbi:MAG TPA: hypothetical protein VF321_07225 [Gaiellaceae bacterium]